MPGFASINGSPVLDMDLYLPRVGAWHADVQADNSTSLASGTPVQLVVGDATFVGTVYRGVEYATRARARVVAGSARLFRTVAKPKSYQGASARQILSDVLAAAGEMLSASADPNLLGRVPERWVVSQQGCEDVGENLPRGGAL